VLLFGYIAKLGNTDTAENKATSNNSIENNITENLENKSIESKEVLYTEPLYFVKIGEAIVVSFQSAKDLTYLKLMYDKALILT